MKTLWTFINGFEIKISRKNGLYLVILILVNLLIGGLLWGLIGRHFLPGVDWLICFMGYPAVLVGFMGGTFYLFSHEFK